MGLVPIIKRKKERKKLGHRTFVKTEFNIKLSELETCSAIIFLKMSHKYSVKLNPADVLSILNSKGYKNITAHQLKEFMLDLKKLIVYEQYSKEFLRECSLRQPEKPTVRNSKPPAEVQERFNELYLTSTCASRARSKDRSSPHHVPVKRDNSKDEHKSRSFKRLSRSSNRSKSMEVKPIRDVQLKPQLCLRSNSENRESAIRTNGIEQGTQTVSRGRRKSVWSRVIPNDPLSLYQHYSRDWTTFKKYLPGENSHSDIRWQIRKKMMVPPSNFIRSRRPVVKKIVSTMGHR